MKLAHIILEQKKYFKDVEDTLIWLARQYFKNIPASDMSVSVGEYAGGRPDSDPRKGRGFATLTFFVKEDLDEKIFKDLLEALEEKFSGRNFKVTNSANWYDYEPGERDYYPTIKVDFNISDHDKEHPDHPSNQPSKPINPDFAADMKSGKYGSLD